MQVARRTPLSLDTQTGEGEEVVGQCPMPAGGLHWPEKDVTVAAGDDGEIGASLEFVAGPNRLWNDDLAFDRESRCHGVRFSYFSRVVKWGIAFLALLSVR